MRPFLPLFTLLLLACADNSPAARAVRGSSGMSLALQLLGLCVCSGILLVALFVAGDLLTARYVAKRTAGESRDGKGRE